MEARVGRGLLDITLSFEKLPSVSEGLATRRVRVLISMECGCEGRLLSQKLQRQFGRVEARVRQEKCST